MRIAPLGVWGASRSDDEVAAAARADAALTHPHPVCLDAAESFSVAIAAAIREGLAPEATWQRALARTRPGTAVRADLEAAVDGPPTDFLTRMGWVRIALRNAFSRLLHAPDPERGIIATVAAGATPTRTALLPVHCWVRYTGGTPSRSAGVTSCSPVAP